MNIRCLLFGHKPLRLYALTNGPLIVLNERDWGLGASKIVDERPLRSRLAL